jgi:2-polyprenyl-3-methyl-5-hydroxy-6-metoxy-1,4-benzoquinol methylase
MLAPAADVTGRPARRGPHRAHNPRVIVCGRKAGDMTATDDARQHQIERTSAWLMAYATSATIRRVRRAVEGDDYPDEADPSTPILTRTGLRRIAGELRVGPGDTIIDVGCGRGGPGLWIARETGAALVGIDLVPLAIEHATARARDLGMHDRARFQLGDAAATGLPTAAFDGAVSVDVLLMIPDKAAVFHEVARLLRPGARFVFTTIEHPNPSSNAGVAQAGDHRPLLADAGLVVETYEETPDWRRRLRAVADGIRDAEAALTEELGAEAAQGWVRWASARPGEIESERHVLIGARKA